MKLDMQSGKTPGQRGRRLELEVLEERIALAGGVDAVVSHGTLFVTGDGSGNDIVIDSAGLGAGEFRVASGADATSVNGSVDDIMHGVTGGIVLRMGDGDDHVKFDGVEVAKNINFYGGDGTNQFELMGNSIVHGAVVAKDADAVAVADATVARDVRISNGAGDSQIVINNLNARSVAVGNGAGNDTIDIDNLTLAGRLSLRNGNGDVTVSLTNCTVSSVSSSSGSGAAGFWADTLTCNSGGMALHVSDSDRTGAVNIASGTIHGSVYVAGDEVNLDDTTVMKGITAVGGIRRFHAQRCDLGIDAANDRYYGVRVSGSNGHLTELIDVRVGRSFTLTSAPYGGLFTYGWPVYVSMDGVRIGGNLNISSWTMGATDCWITGTNVSGRTAISALFNGTDNIEIDDSTFSGAVSINTRWGDDYVAIEANGLPDGVTSTFSGPVAVLTGDGNDTVVLGVAGEPGNHGNYLSRVLFDGGPGSDTLTIVDGANTFTVNPVKIGFDTIIT